MSAASTGSRSARYEFARALFLHGSPRTARPASERIIYGLYTIYDTVDCRKNVEKANALRAARRRARSRRLGLCRRREQLEPLLKEADDYYQQENYKDDRMAKGKALHPRLVAAWDAFASADKALRGGVETINDKRALERLAEIESKRRPQGALPCRGADDPGQARAARERHGEARRRRDHAGARTTTRATVKATEQLAGSGTSGKIGSFFICNAKSYPHHGEAADAPHPRQDAVQPGRPDDAQRRRRLDGRGLAAAPACATTIS